MAYLIQSGLHVSLDGSTWHKLTDHNREPISISQEIIQSESRMANGKMRKYVIAQKDNISASWKYVPTRTYILQDDLVTKDYLTSDENYAAGWIESFYNANAGLPIYLKVISSGYDLGYNTSKTDYKDEPSPGYIPSETSRNFKTSSQLSTISTATYTTANEKDAVSAQELKTSENLKAATGFKVYSVYMTNFSKTIINRTKLSDYVDISIEFTEI